MALKTSGIPGLRNVDYVTSEMPVAEILNVLSQHRCCDITKEINSSQSAPSPMRGGGAGDVYRGRLNTGEVVAIKCPRLYLPGNEGGHKILKKTAHELYAWSRFEHVNVLPLLGVGIFRDRMAMISPWMTNGTMLEYIKHNPNADRYHLSVGASEGLAHLHENGAIHGDLKSGNILVSGEGDVKLADFGCTELKEASLEVSQMSSNMLTMRWAAPEILLDRKKRSKSSDVYALAMTFLEAVTGKIPFSDLESDLAVFRLVALKELPKRPQCFVSFEEDEANVLWKIMEDSWAFEPSERPESTVVRDRLKAIKQKGKQVNCITPVTTTSFYGTEIQKLVVQGCGQGQDTNHLRGSTIPSGSYRYFVDFEQVGVNCQEYSVFCMSIEGDVIFCVDDSTKHHVRRMPPDEDGGCSDSRFIIGSTTYIWTACERKLYYTHPSKAPGCSMADQEKRGCVTLHHSADAAHDEGQRWCYSTKTGGENIPGIGQHVHEPRL